MERRRFIVANWKMNKTVDESVDFVEEFLPLVSGVEDVDMALAPSYISLMPVSEALQGSSVALAAQNMHWEEAGAYTGEISPVMLRDAGCRYVILGHSERRQYFGEGDGEVSRKVLAALQEGIVPVLCVGETLGERDYGKTFDTVGGQIHGGLADVVLQSGQELVLAYEPVWAIGTGKTAGPEEAQEVHSFARSQLADIFGNDVAGSIRILYGGSVKPENAGVLMSMADIDGALVGGASMDPDSFAGIINSV
ncbi:MAG: triose-phosphate isomerase [bacterium]|nr:triose-phosphate isomerase [bacterium]MDT8365241.1 triose-phosphate isomerase [bacterium]